MVKKYPNSVWMLIMEEIMDEGDRGMPPKQGRPPAVNGACPSRNRLIPVDLRDGPAPEASLHCDVRASLLKLIEGLGDAYITIDEFCEHVIKTIGNKEARYFIDRMKEIIRRREDLPCVDEEEEEPRQYDYHVTVVRPLLNMAMTPDDPRKRKRDDDEVPLVSRRNAVQTGAKSANGGGAAAQTSRRAPPPAVQAGAKSANDGGAAQIGTPPPAVQAATRPPAAPTGKPRGRPKKVIVTPSSTKEGGLKKRREEVTKLRDAETKRAAEHTKRVAEHTKKAAEHAKKAADYDRELDEINAALKRCDVERKIEITEGNKAELEAALAAKKTQLEAALAAKRGERDAALAAKKAELDAALDAALDAKRDELDAVLAAKRDELEAAWNVEHAKVQPQIAAFDAKLEKLKGELDAMSRK